MSLRDPKAPVKPFFRVVTPAEARESFGRVGSVGRETVRVEECAGRVLAETLYVPEDQPSFDRAHMDGYAVRARDTFGASSSIPTYLKLSGAVEMGKAPEAALRRGCAMRIATGGMLPEGADSVVMIEYTEEVAGGQVEVQKSVSPWEHVIRIGEDIAAGAEVFPVGRRLRPRDVGALTGIGVTSVPVYARPRVALIGTGDEVVDPATTPKPGQVRNVNQYSLCAMASDAGADVHDLGVCPDEPETFERLLHQGLAEADAVWVSGGSSVGTKDMTLDVIARVPGSEIVFHGISVAPGKPTILALVERADGGVLPILGLPGHPVSALVIGDVFGVPLLRCQGGEPASIAFSPRSTKRARLARNIDSSPGREDYVRVRLRGEAGESLAEPLPGKSGAVFSLVHADGYVVVDLNREGIEAGEEIEVVLF
ncbi:MAG: molybdopterin molybdotransferase MoeA [Candidatus Binatia bacterium]|nr:molybdopterin molybdotransferase MoeA [Candidatus Binatia bacterium]